MDPTVIVAIIGAISTIASAIIANRGTIAMQKKRREKGLIELPAARKEALQGKWKGGGLQREWRKGETVEKDKPHELELELEVDKKLILGSGKATMKELDIDTEWNIIGEGKFRHERFLEFEYRNADPATVSFGYFILVLSPNGKELDGELVGFGETSQKVVSSTMKLTKVS